MKGSCKLWQEFATRKTEDAFRGVVTHYLDFVYAVSLRRVNGDSHLAQDITQIVFSDLARKAHSLPSDLFLRGWLHRHTCFVSGKTIRANHRRRRREQIAAQMNESKSETETSWSRVAPLLDEVIEQLRAVDRAAILLRFFEQQDFRSIAKALGTSEDGARKRVARATEKLRVLLQRRGVALSATGLTGLLTAGVTVTAPAGLAASVGAAAASAIATGGTFMTFSNFVLMGKLKMSMFAGMVARGLIVPIVLQQRSIAKLRDENREMSLQLRQMEAIQADHHSVSNQLAASERDRNFSRQQISELLRLRGEVGVLRRENKELTEKLARGPVPSSPTEGRTALPANVGTATPGAALETFFWAIARGNSDLVSDLLAWQTDESIPDEFVQRIVPSQIRSAMQLTNLIDLRVLAEHALSSNTTRVRLELTEAGGKLRVREVDVIREGDEWRPAMQIKRSGISSTVGVQFFRLPTLELGPTNGLD